MKKLSLIVAGLSVLAGFAVVAANVTSVNIVGYTTVQVPPPGQYTIVGLNFKDVGTNGFLLLSEVVGTNQLKRANAASQADQVILYRNGSYLSIYQRLDGNFYNVSGNTLTNPAIKSGEAFWLKGGTLSQTNKIAIMGEVPGAVSIDQLLKAGYQLFCNPYPTDLNLNGGTINWIANGAKAANAASVADQFILFTDGSYVTYYLRLSDGLWHNLAGGSTNGAVIPVGGGAWYLGRGTYTNVYSRPYTP